METQTFYFIRHPHTNDEVDGIYRGEEASITEEGRQQAQNVAARIGDIHVDRVITSTIPRAVELAQLISAHGILPLTAKGLFKECRKPSVTVGKRRDHPESKRIMKTIRERFDDQYLHSDEENREMLERRVAAALEYLASLPQARIAVVTHGKFLRMIWHYLYEGETLEGFYRKADRRLEHDNVGVTVIALKPNYRNGKRDWTLVTWNDTAVLDVFLTSDLRRALESSMP